MHLLQQKPHDDPIQNVVVPMKSPDDLGSIPSKDKIAPVPAEHSWKIWILSVAMLLAYVSLGTAAAQLASLAFQVQNFKAPFLFVLFKALFRTLAFPIYLTVNTVVKLAKGRKLDYGKTWRRCLLVCGPDGITWRVMLYKFFPPMLANVLVQVGHAVALQYLSPSLAAALVPPSIAISYLMSWIFLKHPLLLVKICFVLVSFAGVAVIVEDQLKGQYDNKILIGILCMLGQNVCLACYQLSFKRAFPKGDLGQVSFAITGVHITMFLCYLPVPVILYLVGYEQYDLLTLPYPLLMGSWTCSSVSVMAYCYGLVVSGPFFMSLGELIGLASLTGVDTLFRHITVSDAQIIGSVVVGVAFLILVVPDGYLSIDITNRIKRWRKASISQDEFLMTPKGALPESQIPWTGTTADKSEINHHLPSEDYVIAATYDEHKELDDSRLPI